MLQVGMVITVAVKAEAEVVAVMGIVTTVTIKAEVVAIVGSRSAQQLEQAMARMEVQIQELDQQLEVLAHDSAALEQVWNEREQLSAAYDELLAQWAEM